MNNDAELSQYVGFKVSPKLIDRIKLAVKKYPDRFGKSKSQFIRISILKLLDDCEKDYEKSLIQNKEVRNDKNTNDAKPRCKFSSRI